LAFQVGKKYLLHFRGKEILGHERLGDVFRGKCTYLIIYGIRRRKNVTFDVKFRNFEAMTK